MQNIVSRQLHGDSETDISLFFYGQSFKTGTWHLKYWGQWYKYAMESKDTYIPWILTSSLPYRPISISLFNLLISTYMPSSSTHGGQHPYHPSTLSSLLLLNLHTLLWFANDSYYGLWHILIWKLILLIHTPLFKNRSSLLNRELSLVL